MHSANTLQPLKLSCPHCESIMRIRSSELLSPLYRRFYLHCENAESCGFRCTAGLELTKTLSPSLYPNPEVEKLPLARRKNR